MRPGSVVRLQTVGRALAALTPSGSLVLDLGGYDGSISTGVPGAGERVVVVDLDGTGLLKARASGAATVRGSATAIPMACGSVDVALSLDLLPCMDRAEGALVYPEVHRVLRPGGHLLVTEVDDRFTLPFVDTAVLFARWGLPSTGLPFDQLADLLSAGGFEVVEHTPFYGLFTRLTYTVLFLWEWPRRASRLKPGVLRTMARIERRWCPAPRAHFVVARARA